MTWDLILLPIVAALIGWGTNVIAIKMLFWPRRPLKFFKWEFLGVLPKRKAEIAESIGDVLNNDLLPIHDLVDAINTKDNRHRVTKIISNNLTGKIDRLLPRFMADAAKSKFSHHLEGFIAVEIESLFAQLGDTISQELQENQLLGNLVEEKINSFDLMELEVLVLKVAQNELRYIEVFGAVIGLIIGIIQVVFLLLVK